MRSLLLRCYPARWRDRYGEEFEAVLAERPLGPFDVADILLGALDAQLRLRGRGAGTRQGRGFRMSLRIGGIAAIIGPALFAVAGVIASGIVGGVDPALGTVVLLSGMAVLLVALAGLSAFQARTEPGLAWAAFLVAAIGTVTGIVGVTGIAVIGESAGELPWLLFALGFLTAFVGCVLFAIVTYRTAALSRRAAVVLGVGSVLPLLAFVAPQLQQTIILVALACFALGWFALGVQAIRLDRPATASRSA